MLVFPVFVICPVLLMVAPVSTTCSEGEMVNSINEVRVEDSEETWKGARYLLG